MQALYDRVVEVFLPNPLDRMGINRLLHERVHTIITTLPPVRTELHNLMGEPMQRRGEVAEGLFRELIAVFSVRNASYLAPQTPRMVAKHAGPDSLFTMTEVVHMFSSPAGALAALIVASSATAGVSNPGVSTLAAVPPHRPANPFAALAPAPSLISQPSEAPSR